MITFIRKISKTHVTFNVCEADLPKKFWPSLISDVTAVVTDNPYHRALTINVCNQDILDAGYQDINIILSGVDPLEVLNGFTEVPRWTHIHYNPGIYTNLSHNLGLLAQEKGWFPDSAFVNFSRYIVAHEYGHSIYKENVPDELVDAAEYDEDSMGGYGKSSPLEAIADAYADWFMTKGKSPRQWTQDAARIMHFPHTMVEA